MNRRVHAWKSTYSAIMVKPKSMPLYSVLQPKTSSTSATPSPISGILITWMPIMLPLRNNQRQRRRRESGSSQVSSARLYAAETLSGPGK